MSDNRFLNLTFEDFKRMANDDTLTVHEKIGFPDTYRENQEDSILKDISGKLPLLNSRGKLVLDIGPGCGKLAHLLVQMCQNQDHHLILADSDEMLNELPDADYIEKIPGYYPCLPDLFSRFKSRIDVILCYSVFHYIFAESNSWDFLDKSLELLSEGGQMLIGDIPNTSMRKRFFTSNSGIRFHQQFMNTTAVPEVNYNVIELGAIDDSVIFALLQRARMQGFDAYVIPQDPALPMANRREDILVKRP